MSLSKKVTFQIEAQDNATKKLSSVKNELSKIGSTYKSVGNDVSSFGKKYESQINSVKAIAKTATIAIVGLATATGALAKKSVEASMKLENSLTGLTTVARAFNVSQEDAKNAAIALAEDGLMTVSEAAGGLKNLLASKFGLDESIKLMNAFKDSAAYNRQAALGFGEAIVGATEGIKNGNSILVDNAGITKNLSVILKEAGYSANDLMNATTDASVRQALYNGLLKEASIFQGDAGRASETLTGKISMLSTAWFNLKAKIGEALAPAVLVLIQSMQEQIKRLGDWIVNNQDKVTAWGKNIAENIAKAINWVKNHEEELRTLGQVVSAMAKVFIKAFEAIIYVLSILTKVLTEIIYYGILASQKIANAWKKTFDFWVGAIDKVYSSWKKLIDFISKPVKAVINIVKKIKGDDGDTDGERAEGGPVSLGKTYLVGEKGPELFTPNSSGTIIPNNQLAGGVTFNFTFNGDISDKSSLINEIKQAINRELELSRYGIG